MNPPETRSDDPAELIDRIVDGGLSPGELRAAVARLDAAPDQWRRCALAFVESQVLREILVSCAADDARPPLSAVVPFRREERAGRRLAVAAAAAALAFGLGWFGRGVEELGRSNLVVQAPRPPDRRNNPPDAVVRVDAPPPERSAPVEAAAPPPVDAWAAGGTPTPQVDVPPQPVEILYEDWLGNQPSAISAHEQALLEHAGYQVEQRREVLFGSLEDGRLAAVPVDQVELKYVGHAPL